MPFRDKPDWKLTLMEGYKSFRAGQYKQEKDLFERLGKDGQNPKVMLIACADSRADPSDIFDAHPGEMFVVRNVANLVPPKDDRDGFHGTTAALEYAVNVLKVEAIVVMGHESCGGINACLHGAGDDPDSYVGRWISMLNGARDRVKATVPENEQSLALEFEGVRQTLLNLKTFPCVQERLADGNLTLMGAYFSIIRGVLMFAGDDGTFHEVPPV